LASNKEILAENIEEFNNATIDELQKIWERADELNLSSEAKKALGKTIEEAKIY